MDTKNVSTYYFLGRLSPSSACSSFRVDNLQIGDGLVFEVIYDGVSIWKAGVEEDFHSMRSQVLGAFEIIINTFIFLTGDNLGFSLQEWIEAKEVVADKNVVGFIVHKRVLENKADPQSNESQAWRKAGQFYEKINLSFNHRIALNDHKNALNTINTDDCFFYAYRCLENVCRSIAQPADGEIKAAHWNQMHNVLETSFDQIKPLKDAADAVRHGDLSAAQLISARQSKDQMIQIAVDVMKKEFVRTFQGLI